MGRGNWFPGSQLEDCEVFYVEIPVVNEEGEHDDDSEAYLFRWDDFKHELKQACGKSFTWEPDYRWIQSRFDGMGRNDRCLAYNGLFGVFIDEQGDFHHQGVGFLVRNDAPAFARSRMSDFADKVADKLQELYDLSVRTSAWTSGKREMSKA